MIKHLLSRRQFNASCAAFGLSLPTMSAMVAVKGSARVLGTGAASKTAGRTVKAPDGTTIPALGQGSSHLGLGGIRQLLKKRRCA